jgi:hypothetical protein
MRIISSIRSTLFVLLLAMSAVAYAQISVSISFAPSNARLRAAALSGRRLSPDTRVLGLPDDDYYWVPGHG